MRDAVVHQLLQALGSKKVSTDAADLAATSHDTWPVATTWAKLGRHPHAGDVLVRATGEQDVVDVLTIASSASTPVTVRALGSSVTGQPIPVRGGIVLDVSGLPHTCQVDDVDLTVTVSASYNGGALEDELAARGLTLGHSPQSLYRSSVGGWLATLATGQFSSLYGGIEDLVVGYRVVLATGEAIDLRARPRAAMGPDLRQLFLGSEGTLGIITSVTLKVFRAPEVRLVETFAVPTVGAGLAIMREQVQSGLRPFLSRFYDADEARHAMADPDVTTPVMFVGAQGAAEAAALEMSALRRIAEDHGATSLGEAGADAWMDRRFDFSGVENLLATPGGYAETIEVAHTWRHIEAFYLDLKAALKPLADEVLGHFSHVYPQGTSLYVILLGRATDDEHALDRLTEIWRTAMRVGLENGAELSHHHGGGLARSPYARASLGDAHLLLRKLKGALDPAGILNPGKLGLLD